MSSTSTPYPKMTTATPNRTLKRAAEDDLQASPSKSHRCTGPSSINGILREYASQRLYVQPLHWTAKHLHLLGCVFVAGNFVAGGESSSDRAGNRMKSDTTLVRSVARATACLGHGSVLEIKAAVICDLLRDHGFYSVRYLQPFALDLRTLLIWSSACSTSEIGFAFAKRPVCHLPIDGLFAPSPTAPAGLVFLDFENLAKRRDKSIQKPIGSRMNPPVVRLRQKKQAHIRPANTIHDPYIAAVLLCLAQGQRHAVVHPGKHESRAAIKSLSAESMGPCKDSMSLEVSHYPLSAFKIDKQQVFLLATAASKLYLYAAKIPLAFLDRLDNPSKDSFVEPVLLRYHCLPFQSSNQISKTLQHILMSLNKTSHR